ncbi:MAG: O-antigen ligase family protein [Chloroflexi bacterium]|nr:O-antigen ligase family protein [Chloroflexota bacterium]
MRSFLLLVVALMLVVGSLAATLGTMQLRDFELRGYIDPTKDQRLPFTVDRAGVNVELLQYGDAELISALERIRAARFRWLRQFVYWDEIERRRNEFDWSAWDRLASALRDFPELESVVVLMNSPAWARPQRGGAELTSSAPPESPHDLAAFGAEFARRYGDLIDYYQIWDEPNLGDAWGGQDPRASEYVTLLAAARSAILSADPAAKIVAAGLAPTVETAGRNISDIRYLQAMYAQGARELMDVVAGKPYGQFDSPMDRRVDEDVLNFSRIVALREVMLANDDVRTPLWASNYGWNALPGDWSGDASIWGAVDAIERTRYTLHALDRAHREMPWLGPMFLHHWQPAASPESAQWGFALVNQDGSASELLRALEAYAYPDLAQNGLYHARNAHARYSGVWRFSERGADIGWLQSTDSQLAFDFYGSDVALLLREDDYIGFLYPTVDGQPAKALQQDANGNAYIMLRSNSRAPETNLVPIATGLNLGRHTLHASADQGWDRWAIAGYAVSSGDLSAPYDRQIALGVITTGLAALVLALSIATAPWTEWLPRLRNLLAGLSATTSLVIAGLTSVSMMLAMLWTWDSPKASVFARDEVNLLLVLLTGGALYFSKSLLLSILFALLLFIQIYHRLANGLLLILLWAPFFLKPVELHSYAIPMVEALLLITAAAGAIKMIAAIGQRLQMANSGFPIFSRESLPKITVIDGAVAGLTLLGCLSLLWTDHLDKATTELRTLIVEPAIFYLLIRLLQPQKGTLFRLCLALVAAGVLACLIGLGEVILGMGELPLRGVYGSPNNIGLLLGRAIPMALAIGLVNLEARWRWAALGSLAIMLPALLLTQSLGAFALGLPAGCVCVIIGLFGRKTIVPLLLVALAGAVVLLLLPQTLTGVANMLDLSSGTSFVRLRLWESTIAIIRDRPITGLGLDQFLYHYGGEYVRPDAIWDANLSHPHNFILDFWTRLSIFAVGAFLLLQVSFWRGAHSILVKTRGRDPRSFAMTLGLAGSMAALLAHGLVDNSVFVIDLAFIFVFQLAALLRLRELTKPARV